ncbi:S1 RNA-binding domain-containing protein [Candidatus Saccharibacteria bacterium CPR2]|nr:S1 RNA-binding domain-containing protein [Candidatus Saccharibacteria bacterium CPR2]
MAKKTDTGSVTMEKLLNDHPVKQLVTGDLVEGVVTKEEKHEVWVDLGPYGMGLVIRREIGFSHELKVGDSVTACVLDPEIEGGYVLLSLRKAVKDRGWDELKSIHESGDTIEIKPYDANRGGLLVELEGIRGFLPVSQLSAEHYPRVVGADKDEILQRLNQLIKQPIRARILDIDRKQNKLIFSEKEAVREDMQKKFKEMAIGDTVKGTVTGVVDFGAFVNVDGIEGLIHISEISWDRVENPSDYIKAGQDVEAKIIAIDKDRLSLSLKQTQEDPWMKEVKPYKKGDTVEGTVTRITPFGAFIQISPAVEALVHVSELGGDESNDPEKIFKLNEKKKFKILDIDKEARKISLSLKT